MEARQGAAESRPAGCSRLTCGAAGALTARIATTCLWPPAAANGTVHMATRTGSLLKMCDVVQTACCWELARLLARRWPPAVLLTQARPPRLRLP